MFGISVSCPQLGHSGATAHGWMLAGNSARRVCSSGLGPDHPTMWPSPRCYQTMRWKVGFGDLRMGMLMQLVFLGGFEHALLWNVYIFTIYAFWESNRVWLDRIGRNLCCKCTAGYSYYGQSAKKLMSPTDKDTHRMTHADAILHHLLSMDLDMEKQVYVFTGMSLVLLVHLRDQCPYTCTLDTCQWSKLKRNIFFQTYFHYHPSHNHGSVKKPRVTPIVTTVQIFRHSCTEPWLWEKGWLTITSCCLVMAVKLVGFGSSLPEAKIWKWMVGFDDSSPFGDGWTWQVRTVASFRECSSKNEFHHFLLWISALPPPVRWPGLTGDVAQYEAACKSLARHAHRLSPERLVKAVDAWKDLSDFWLASVVFQVTTREWCQRVCIFYIYLRKLSEFTFFSKTGRKHQLVFYWNMVCHGLPNFFTEPGFGSMKPGLLGRFARKSKHVSWSKIWMMYL